MNGTLPTQPSEPHTRSGCSLQPHFSTDPTTKPELKLLAG